MNQNVFIELINPFKDKVFRLAKRLLTSTEEAEDATQEVIVKLWNKKENLDNYNSVEALAMTMTKNYCLDQLKSKRAGNLQIVHNNYTDRDPQLDKKLEDSNSLEWVEKIISQLPEQLQILIQLRDVEQYEFDEIAKIVNMNETAIRVALSRARKKLENQWLTHTVMELDKIEYILEKYFQGETSIAEENQLKEYFSSPNVAQHLEQYKPMFGYFSQVKEQKSTHDIPLKTKKRNVAWLSIAASVVVLLGVGTYFYVSEKNAAPAVAQTELGTYDDPEEALAATQKALALLSSNVNVGIESVQYINEYEQSKNKIFKQ